MSVNTYNIAGLFIDPILRDKLLKYVVNTYPLINLYGNINFSWNSGRSLPEVAPTKLTSKVRNSIQEEFEYWEGSGVGIYLTFTSTDIDMSSPIGIYLLDKLNKCDAPRKGVILQNEILRKYIRSEYPDIELVSSILKATNDYPVRRPSDYYKGLLNLYDRVVLHPDDNYHPNILQGVDTSRVEVLANEVCSIDCKVRKRHYSIIEQTSKAHTVELLNIAMDKESELWGSLCPKGREETTPYLDMDNLRVLYGLGVTSWKLQGRWQPDSTVYSYLDCIHEINNITYGETV